MTECLLAKGPSLKGAGWSPSWPHHLEQNQPLIPFCSSNIPSSSPFQGVRTCCSLNLEHPSLCVHGAGSFFSLGSQHRGHLLRELFPEHPVSVRCHLLPPALRLPLSVILCSTQQYLKSICLSIRWAPLWQGLPSCPLLYPSTSKQFDMQEASRACWMNEWTNARIERAYSRVAHNADTSPRGWVTPRVESSLDCPD